MWEIEAGRVVTKDGKRMFAFEVPGEPGRDYHPVELDDLAKRVVTLLNLDDDFESWIAGVS